MLLRLGHGYLWETLFSLPQRKVVFMESECSYPSSCLKVREISKKIRHVDNIINFLTPQLGPNHALLLVQL